MRFTKKNSRGFTLIEVVISISIFAILVSGILGSFAALTRTVKAGREKAVLASLATNYLEIVRNLPYSEVGTAAGNPTGTLADAVTPIVTAIESTTYNIYYEVTYIDDSADGTALASTDPAPNDYKQVKMFVENMATGAITSFVTTVAPRGLEGLTDAGALFINVINSVGQPVAGADIHIQSPPDTPTLQLDRTSDSAGQWIEVGLPEGVNAYRIVVTKEGYTTDQTYPITVQNPNPIKPDATIIEGQVTQITFTVDLLASLTIRTLDSLCQPLSPIDVNLRGAKLIGTNPDILKYDETHTSAGGQIVLDDLEWDTYTPALAAGQGYIVYGTSPVQQVVVNPGSSQLFTMILGTSSTDYSLLVLVKDAATGAALEGATVHLIKGGSEPQDYYGTTGGSVWKQIDWTGGGGQALWIIDDQYFADNGNIDINSVPTGVRLVKVTGDYISPGDLESSTFDTGAGSDFTTITWEPTSQDPSATLKFQVAAASVEDPGAWTYLGPDGTGSTYYTVPGTTINAVHDGSRYIRYKAFLETTNDKKTPVLTSIHLNYVSGCFTPGQVIFTDLTQGQNYDLEVSLTGFQTQTINSLNIEGHQLIEVLMSP